MVEFCRTCRAEVIWVTAEAGNRIPLSVSSMTYRLVRYGRNGERCKMVETYQSHCLDCPDTKLKVETTPDRVLLEDHSG